MRAGKCQCPFSKTFSALRASSRFWTHVSYLCKSCSFFSFPLARPVLSSVVRDTSSSSRFGLSLVLLCQVFFLSLTSNPMCYNRLVISSHLLCLDVFFPSELAELCEEDLHHGDVPSGIVVFFSNVTTGLRLFLFVGGEDDLVRLFILLLGTKLPSIQTTHFAYGRSTGRPSQRPTIECVSNPAIHPLSVCSNFPPPHSGNNPSGSGAKRVCRLPLPGRPLSPNQMSAARFHIPQGCCTPQ